MKNMSLKTIFLVTLIGVILFSMTLVVSAAPVYTIKATYISADTIEYEATATGLTPNTEATYFAQYTSWHYFNQMTVPANGNVKFVYRGPAETADSTYGTSDTVVKFGDEINVGSDTATEATKEGIDIIVNVDNAPKTVTVPAQNENVQPTRYIKLEGSNINTSGMSDKISGVEYTDASGTDSHSGDYSIGTNIIILENTDIITADGTLSVTTAPVTTPKVDFEYYTYYNDNRQVPQNPNTIDFLANCEVPENYEFGIMIAKDGEDIGATTKVDVDATAADPANLVSGQAFVFKATTKNSSGEYAVSIEKIIRYLDAGTYKVYAYIKDGSGVYSTDDTAISGTNVFSIDASGKCSR